MKTVAHPFFDAGQDFKMLWVNDRLVSPFQDLSCTNLLAIDNSRRKNNVCSFLGEEKEPEAPSQKEEAKQCRASVVLTEWSAEVQNRRMVITKTSLELRSAGLLDAEPRPTCSVDLASVLWSPWGQLRSQEICGAPLLTPTHFLFFPLRWCILCTPPLRPCLRGLDSNYCKSMLTYASRGALKRASGN